MLLDAKHLDMPEGTVEGKSAKLQPQTLSVGKTNMQRFVGDKSQVESRPSKT